MKTTTIGYPRIGARRELKFATERHWAGTIDGTELGRVSAGLRAGVWRELADAGLDEIPSGTFSLYDQVLDVSVLVDAIPRRYRDLTGLDRYFAMARGVDEVPPLEMTKWFDTNYHYIVSELDPSMSLRLAEGDDAAPLREYREAKELGIETRPVIVGPLTYLLLAKAAPGAGDFTPLDLLDDLVEVYADLLRRLGEAGASWVQLDEPCLVADRTGDQLDAFRRAYARLGAAAGRPRILVATYFGTPAAPVLSALADAPVEAVALDLVTSPTAVEDVAAAGGLPGKTLVAGVVDGRNVWRTDTARARGALAEAAALADDVVVSTSCSLLHVPVDLACETGLEPDVRDRLAFARQKIAEVVALGRQGEGDATPPPPARRDETVRRRLAELGDTVRGDRSARLAAQKESLGLPDLATTTIGSFPQTREIRKARADHRAGRIDDAAYEQAMRAEIEANIERQHALGLDVFVHGEPERNDMVQYFAEQLDGYAATEFGWVQSYGTRCVRPPILHGDVSRPHPMTVDWATYAQSLTDRPVKGMLTGPVTMLAWSFVRDDQPLADTARQVALALRDEVADLEAAGIRIVQVDEPALRELLPLRRADQEAYLSWAVAAFRLATSGASDETQIHTHMCYSEFGEIVSTIDQLDADVTTVEAARSGMEFVADLQAIGYSGGIGPGVYDIHSPRVPTAHEVEANLRAAIEAVSPGLLWVNPDCGLKTRGWPETEAALANLVTAARRVREGITAGA